MKLFLSIFFFMPMFSLCQEIQTSSETAVITDSSVVVGTLGDVVTFYESIGDGCSPSGYKVLLTKGVPVAIAGGTICRKFSARYLKVIYRQKLYYIDEESITVAVKPYDKLFEFSYEESENFMRKAWRNDSILNMIKVNEFEKYRKKGESTGLVILKWGIADESEHTSGTSASFEVYNPTKKTIKYLWFSVVGYNAVGDKVIDRTRKTASIQLKGVGPIAPGSTGSYSYSYVWFTDLVEDAKIINIKVQYMDGTFKTILNPNEVTIPRSLYNFFFRMDEE